MSEETEEKATSQIYSEVLFCEDIDLYLAENDSHLAFPSLPCLLATFLTEKNTTKRAVIERAQMNQIYGYHIFSGHRKPMRDKLLQIAFGFPLDEKETQRLLRSGGQRTLYVRDKRDSVLLFCLGKGVDLLQAEELLLRLGLDGVMRESETDVR